MRNSNMAILHRILVLMVVVAFAGQAAAQTLGCAANSLNPSFGNNYGTSLDGGQTWEVIEGDPALIAVGSEGRTALWAC
jgi:hypothetical protein